jgi:hypothetical protein
VPGFSFTDSVLVPPPLNVGVAPTTPPPVPCWIVKLCGTIEALVNVIVTLPAFAVSEGFTNFKLPLGSAACVSALAPPAGVLLAAELVEEEVELAGAEVLLLLLLDPPHAARPRTSAVMLSARDGNLVTVGFSIQGVGTGAGGLGHLREAPESDH